MGYQVKIKSLAERESKIRASVQASTETRDFYEFRNQKSQLKLVRVASDLILYRMDNFRTFTGQHAYISRESKPVDFFATGQENESVQQLQHEILAKLARTGRADSVTPVLDILRIEKQREPILITLRGVVVNGNRRVAAMREIFAESQAENAVFSHFDCLVLPEDVTPEEIIEIEARLQAKPETKLEYDWVGDAQLLQKLLDIGQSVAQVAEKLNRKAPEIRNALAAFNEAKVYLKDWAKAENDYERVTRDGEQFFKDLPAQVQNKDPSLADASRIIAWNLFENKGELNDRLYAFNIAFGRNAAGVLDTLSAELGVPLSGVSAPDDGSFEIDVDAGDETISYQPIIDIFKDPEKRDDAVELLIPICRDVIERERGDKSGNAALKTVSSANARLTEVDLSRAKATTYDAIDKQLEQIEKRTAKLRETLATLRANVAMPASTKSA